MAKILIIEDDPLISRMYQKIFLFDGHEVEKAFNGADGFEKAKLFQPNLILCDIMMPKMNGIECLQKLKECPVTKSVPVVMLTNLSGTQDAELALTKGAVKYIVKSAYDPKKISDMVKEVLLGYTRNEIPKI